MKTWGAVQEQLDWCGVSVCGHLRVYACATHTVFVFQEGEVAQAG